MRHVPVMVDEVLRFLIHDNSKLILDGTVACGGHARAILESNPDIELIGVDRDGDALAVAKTVLSPFAGRVRLIRGSYADVKGILADAGGDAPGLGSHAVTGADAGAGDDVDSDVADRPVAPREPGPFDGVLLDLGLSSLQLDDPSRGFGYQHDGPLDMRMSKTGRTAKALIEQSSGDELQRILREYGEVPKARRIARAIRKAADGGAMSSTFEMRAAVESVVGRRVAPAALSRVFQAFRIALNGELDNITAFLGSIIDRMNEGGRIVVISYHSLEDRLVKNFFREKSARCVCPPSVPVCVCGQVPSLEVLTRRVVKPTAAEVAVNPRSRSARLRAAKVVKSL